MQMRRARAMVLAAGVCSVALWSNAARGDVFTWDDVGNPGSLWNDPLNWDGAAPTDADFDNSDSNILQLQFGSSTNTMVNLRPLTSYVDSITIGASAPSYTFQQDGPGGEIYFRNSGLQFQNDSPHAQTINVDYLTINATSDFVNNGGKVTVNGRVYFSGGRTAYFYGPGEFEIGFLSGSNNSSAVRTYVEGAGVTTILGASGEAQDGTRNYTVHIGNPNADQIGGQWGSIRVANALAFGAGTVNLYGRTTNNGRLELTGGINFGARIQNFEGRGNGFGNTVGGGLVDYNAGLAVAILNKSGDNTLSSTLALAAGGGQYNFGSESGKLTVTSDVEIGATFARYLTFRGAGDGEFSGKIGNFNTASGMMPVMHYGSGNLILSGGSNYRLGHQMSLGGGTLKYGANFGNDDADQGNYPLFNPAGVDDSVTPNALRFHVQNGSTMDFSEMTKTGGSNIGLPGGGLLLGLTMSGAGNILGDVVTTTGANFKPGDIVGFDTDDASVIDFPQEVGILAFSGNLDMSEGSPDYAWDLKNLSEGGPGANWDQITVAGNVTPGGTVTLGFLSPGVDPSGGDAFWLSDHSWKILDANDNPTLSNFALTNGSFANGEFSLSLGSGPDNGDVLLNWVAVVPEPATLSLMAFGSLGLLRRRRA